MICHLNPDKLLRNFISEWNNSGTVFDFAVKEKRLTEIEQIIGKNDFWDNPDNAKSVLKERTQLSDKIESFKKLYKDI